MSEAEVQQTVSLRCPVSSKEIPCHVATPSLLVSNGQRILLCSNECERSLSEETHAYMRHPNHDECDSGIFCNSLAIEGAKVKCPTCKTELTICLSETPRTVLRYGQAIFFDSYECQTKFNMKPNKYLKPRKKGKSSAIRANCPCDGEAIIATSHTPTVHVDGGQRLFLCSCNCTMNFTQNVTAMVKSTRETIPYQPEATGVRMNCPICFKAFIADTNATPRVQFSYGQSVYFDSYCCLETALHDGSSLGNIMHQKFEDVRGVPACEKSAEKKPDQEAEGVEEAAEVLP